MKRLLAVALASVLALSAAAAGADRSAQEPRGKRARAHAALERVERLRDGRGIRTGRELSPALAQLAGALPALSGDDRRQAEAILARPDDAQSDPGDTHKWSKTAVKATPFCTERFCIHWVKTTADAPSLADTDADGTPDYVEQMAAILEDEVHRCENGTGPADCGGAPGLGWREPASDFGLGGDDRTDVYIQDLFANEGVFGYVAVDPGQAESPSVPHFAYMVLDKDYRRYGDGSATAGLAAERVTAAHEYNHVLQNAYDYLEDVWMLESTAVYMEEKVYPEIDDYLGYVRAWTENVAQPLTTFVTANRKAYGSAVWSHWLEHRFGVPAVRAAWEGSIAAGDFAPGAYSSAITAAGGAGFADEFGRFAAAVAEWNAPGSGFPDPYPEVPRDGALAAGSGTQPFALAHTTFKLFDVPVPPDSPALIRLTATLPDATAGAIALVGRTGGDPASGSVTSSLTQLPAGGTGAAELTNPGGFGRITAVVANADTSHAGFDFATGDYTFTKDAPSVVAAVAQPGPPVPTTGVAGLVGDHGVFVTGDVDPHLLDTTWWIEYGRTSAYGSQTEPRPLAAATVGSASVVAPVDGLEDDTVYHFRVLAGNAAGTVAGDDATFRTAEDVTAPKLSIKTKPMKLATVRARGLLYLVRCSESCRGTARVTISRRSARRLGLPRRLGKARVRVVARKHSRVKRVRLRRHIARVLLRQHRRVTVKVNLRVADGAGNQAVSRSWVRLSP